MKVPARDELRRLLDAFDTALDKGAADRADWLAALEATDPVFGARLRVLLDARERAETSGFLQEPAWHALPPLPAERDDAGTQALAAGTDIGGYRLERELGVGGMGTVWLAERADGLIKRPVALKLPHAGPFARVYAERFARERAIVAALEHPHIARLYDAGVTPQGQPFLALEYVEGERLDQWCDERRLDLAARLRLFLDVLGAVQYAHGRLVVHRDLKPANLLVTRDGRVKLLDFGIARLLADAEPAGAALTQAGSLAFTPDYASPEQITGAPIGVASDVYSLGIVLYELLCGRRPYQLARASRGALEDAIVSAAVQRPSDGAIDPAAAQRRAADPARLRRALRGDLDTIVTTALARDPAARYATCSAFADDLQRFLDGRPVLARPASRWYRARKFVLRHRWSVGAATAFVLLVGASAIVAGVQAVKARAEAARADAIQRFVVGVFERNSAAQPDMAKARSTTVRELLDLGRDELLAKPPQEPAVAEALLTTFSEMYFHLGLEGESLHLDRARLELDRRAFGELDARTLAAQRDVGQVLLKQSTNKDELAALATDLVAKLDRIGDRASRLRAEAETLLAQALNEQNLTEAIDHQRRSVALWRRFPDDPELPLVLAGLAHMQARRGDVPDARASIHDAIAVWSRSPGRRAMEEGPLQLHLGQISEANDEPGVAETAYRRALELDRKQADPSSWQAYRNWLYLGRLLARTGRATDVLEEGAKMLAVAGTASTAPPWFRAWALSVALEAATTARNTGAMQEYASTLERIGCRQDGSYVDAWCRAALLEFHLARGDRIRAAALLDELENDQPARSVRSLPPLASIYLLQQIAAAHLALGALPRAAATAREARQQLTAQAVQPTLADLRLGLVERSVLLAQGDAAAAQALAERLERRLAAHPDRAIFRHYETALRAR